jgi:hypothetical protein
MNENFRFFDVLYFLAEMAVYAAVVWWAVSQDSTILIRVLLAIGGVAIFATTWAVFAAPGAPIHLHGIQDVAFRIAWFALGATAGIAALLHH